MLMLTGLGLGGAAHADMDIEDRGPVLDAGNFTMRVTNIGVVGNAFFDVGLSFDPSFEYPRGSGQEALNHAALWVGARLPNGRTRVSGGPLLEFRPTLDPADRVITNWAGAPGTRRGFDDDGDGRFDEEISNRRDDDGDGEVDEDLGFSSQKMLAADYVDDRPEAINYGYSNGESHEPLGISVHQETFAWSAPGYDNMAGIEYTVTNHGTQVLEDVYLGFYADLDSRRRLEPGGYLDDVVEWKDWSYEVFEGTSTLASVWIKQCWTRLGGRVPVLRDRHPDSGRPNVAVIPFRHTTDPLVYVTNTAYPGVADAMRHVRAPARDTTFRFTVFAEDLPPGQGGPPILDDDRYAALAGTFPGTARSEPRDYSVLLRCGPFVRLEPGQSLTFALGIVVTTDPDSVPSALRNAAYTHKGVQANLLADAPNAIVGGSGNIQVGLSGHNGHEVCYEPPPGVVFDYDPDCLQKFTYDLAYRPFPAPTPGGQRQVTYRAGSCIWSDLDCDACTGLFGRETWLPWLDPGAAPPGPAMRSIPGDHAVTVQWDNQPEIVLGAGLIGASGYQFAGYRLYRLSDWKRSSVLPPPTSWQLLAAFGPDTLQLEQPLAAAIDSTVDYDAIRYNQRHYPIGRYRFVDQDVLNGFDYLYVVTTIAERRTTVGSAVRVERLESPLVAMIDSLVVPNARSLPGAGRPWVVPNPYRASSPWDRPPVPGDPFGRHVDFMGLPNARATIKIWTLAGDLVQTIVHDGSGGDGQASWDLISRNGQDVESGIYLFTVESSAGTTRGRFVVVR